MPTPVRKEEKESGPVQTGRQVLIWSLALARSQEAQQTLSTHWEAGILSGLAGLLAGRPHRQHTSPFPTLPPAPGRARKVLIRLNCFSLPGVGCGAKWHCLAHANLESQEGGRVSQGPAAPPSPGPSRPLEPARTI